MTDSMDDDFGFGRLIENEIGIRRCRHAADGRIVRARADGRMRQQKIDDDLDMRPCTLRAPCGEWAAI